VPIPRGGIYQQPTTTTWSSLNTAVDHSSSQSSSTSSMRAAPATNPTTAQEAFERAKMLQELARQTRLEAEQMDTMLTLEKIEKLEKRLADNISVHDVPGNSIAGDISETVDIDAPHARIHTVHDHEYRAELNLEEAESDSEEQSGINRSKETEEELDIRRQIRFLRDHLEESKPASTLNTALKHGSTIDPTASLSNKELMSRVKEYLALPESIKYMYTKALGMDFDTTGYPIFDADAPAIVKKIHEEEMKRPGDFESESVEGKGRSFTELETAFAYAGYWRLPLPIKAMIASDVGIPFDESSATSPSCEDITKVMDELFEKDMIKLESDGIRFLLTGEVGQIDDKTIVGNDNLQKTDEIIDIKEYEISFNHLPNAIKRQLAQSVNIDDITSTTTIVQKLVDEGRMKPGPNGDGVQFAMDMKGESEELLHDDGYMTEIMPEFTRNLKSIPKRSDVDTFFAKALGKNTFNPVQKPEAVPGGFIIWGDNRLVKSDLLLSDDGTTSSDDLVDALHESMEKEDLLDRLQVFYMMDPTAGRLKDKMNQNNYGGPVLFVTGPNIAPDTRALAKPLISLLGVASTLGFSIFLYFGKGAVNNIEGLVSDANAGFWLQDSLTPLLFSIFLPQLAHEISHQVIAFKDEFKIGFPTIVPSPQIGIQGLITPIKTPPKNLNSLFDFAITGPLVGMLLSIAFIYAGLEKQVFMDVAAQAQLPAVPMGLAKASTLGGGMIEWLLGDGILRSSDPSALIRLHPYAVGGFIGVFVNALSLLPIGNTDGGRVSTSLFGRGYARIISVGVVWTLLFCGVLGNKQFDLLFYYALFASFYQKDMEIPCRNEVDGIDDFRAIVAFGSAVLAALVLIPLDVA